tara:strand:- start:3731 stop:7048 length:3318 start_codon:yes stop_codon:yes gene_type:complete
MAEELDSISPELLPTEFTPMEFNPIEFGLPEQTEQSESNRFVAKVTLENGLKMTVRSTDGLPLTDEKVMMRIKQDQAKAIASFTAGNPYPEKTEVPSYVPSMSGPGMGVSPIPIKKTAQTKLSKKEWYDKFYTDHLKIIMGVPPGKFDFNNGLSKEVPRSEPIPAEIRAFSANQYTDPVALSMGMRTGISDRAKYGLFQTLESKMAFLIKKFGNENVSHQRSAGTDVVLFRENKDGKWRFPEGSHMIEMADFTSDLSGEAIPTAASVITGLSTMELGPAAATGVSVATYGTVGAAQDYLVEKSILGKTDVSEIAWRRTKQAAIQGLIEYPTMKFGGMFLKSFFGREGSDAFHEAMTSFVKISDNADQLPRAPFLSKGLEIANSGKSVAARFPNGAVAKTMDEYRVSAGSQFAGEINPSGGTARTAEDGFREGAEHVSTRLTQGRDRLLDALEVLKRKEEAIGNTVKAKALQDSQKEAVTMYKAQIAKFEADVLAGRKISPAAGGEIAQTRLAEAFVDVNVKKSQNFNDAYELLGDLTVPVSDVNQVFSKSSSDLITDINDEAVGVINANARNTAGSALIRLDELGDAGGTLDFKTVNELIQKVEEKTRRGKQIAGFDANQYRRLADDLRGLRSQMLESPLADAQGVAQFEYANTFFKDNYLPYIDVESLYRPKIGQSYNDAILAKTEGAGGLLPPRDMKPDPVLSKIVENSGTIKEFLELSGGGMDMRLLLRDYWLQSKGLVAGRPINPKKIVSLFSKEGENMDIIRTLWSEGQEGKAVDGIAGFNSKVKIFEDLEALVGNQKDITAEISATTFERIMNAGSKVEQDAIAKIAREETLIKERLNKHSKKLVQMVDNGELPVPNGRVTMDTFLAGLKSSTPAEQLKFIEALRKADPALVDDLQGSLFHSMVRNANANSNPTNINAFSVKDNMLWDAIQMKSELKSNQKLITSLLTKDGYENLVTFNTKLEALMKPTYQASSDSAKPRFAMTSSGVTGWIGNVTAPVSDTLGALVLGMQTRVPWEPLIFTGKTYDQIQTGILRTLFLSAKGYEMLNSEAESSPEFNAFLTENLTNLKKEIKELKPTVNQQVQDQKAATQMPPLQPPQ